MRTMERQPSETEAEPSWDDFPTLVSAPIPSHRSEKVLGIYYEYLAAGGERIQAFDKLRDAVSNGDIASGAAGLQRPVTGSVSQDLGALGSTRHQGPLD